MERHTLVTAAEHQTVTCKLAGECTTVNKCYNSLYRAIIPPFPFLYGPGKGGKSSKTGKPSAGIKSSHLWIQRHSSSAVWKHMSCSAFDGDRVMNLEANRQQEATVSQLAV